MAQLNGLVCYYNFELPNQLQNAISGSSLSVSGTTTYSGSAKYGTYSLSSRSGTTNYFTSTDSGVLSLGNFCTLSLWFNPASVPQTSRLLNISNSSGVCIGCGINSYGVFYDIAGTVVYFSESSSDYIGFGSGWNHLAITYSMSVAGTTNIGVYLNGVMIQNPSTTAASYIWRTSTGTATTLTFFGTANGVSSTTCNVDEVMIFNRALTTNEVMNLYNLYNNNYNDLTTSGQTSLLQSSYGSTSIIADRLLSSGGITTNGQITTNNNNINAGLGTITCGNLNLVSSSEPTVSGGFVSTVGSTGWLTCGQITSTGNITATGQTLTCGPIKCNSVSSTPLIVERSSISATGVDISVSGNFMYIIYLFNRIDKYDFSTKQTTTITPGYSFLRKIANYQGSMYITVDPNRVLKIDDSGNVTSPLVNVGTNTYHGLCIYNGIAYLGVISSTTCIRAFDLATNQPLVGFTNPVADTNTQYHHVSVFNNIIYAADAQNNRISTFNATTGAIINLNLITGLTNLNAVESDGSILYVLCNLNIIYAYSLSGILISTLLSVPTGGLRCIRIYGGALYVVSSSSVKTYQIVGTGSLTCGQITSASITTGDINAGIGALTSGSITTGAITATGLTCGTIATTGNVSIAGQRLTCGNITSTTITTGNNDINAGTGALSCGAITTTGALNASGQTITCATLNGNLASTYITGTISASQVTGLTVTSSLAASTITPGTLNIGSSNSLTCGPISSTTINTNNNNINAGTGTLACGALTSTTITTGNNPINAGTGAITCGAITASGAITATGQTLACGALTSTTITTNNNNINAGTGTLSCGAITTTGALNATGQTITAGSLTSGNVNFSGTRSGIYWGYGGSKIYDDAELTLESDNNVIVQLNATSGTSGTFQIRSQNRTTGGALSCGAISATGAITVTGGSITASGQTLTCGAITTGGSDVNAGTGTLTCGIINASGAINASASTITCATLSGNLAATRITGTLADSQLAAISATKVTGSLVNNQIADVAATKITAGALNIGTNTLNCGAITSTSINTTNGGISAGTGTVNCGIIVATGAIITPHSVVRGATLIGNLLSEYITGTLSDSQIYRVSASKITGTLTDLQLAEISASKITGTLADNQLAAISASKITAGLLNIGTNTLTCGAVNAGTGTLTCGTINASGTITCSTLSGSLAANKITPGALNIGSNTLNCGAITTNNNNINAGTGTITCGILDGTLNASKISGTIPASQISGLTSTTSLPASSITAAALNIGTNAITCGNINITGGAVAKTGLYWGHGSSRIYDDGEFTVSSDNFVDVLVNNAATEGAFRVFSGTKNTAGRLQCGKIICGDIICDNPRFNLTNSDSAEAKAALGLSYGSTRLDIAWNWRGGFAEITYINNSGGGHLFLSYYSSGVSYASVTSAGFYTASDRRLKRNIMKVTPSLENILKLNPVTFNYTHDASDERVHAGFVAQDLEEVFPNCVSTNPSEDINLRIKTINMSEIIPYIVKSIQEQHDIVVSQQSQITELKSTVSSQQSQIDSLTQQLADLKALVQTRLPNP